MELKPEWPEERIGEIRQNMSERQNTADGSMREKMEEELGDIFYTLNGSCSKIESAQNDVMTFPVLAYDDTGGHDNADDDNGSNHDVGDSSSGDEQEAMAICFDDDEDSNNDNNSHARRRQGRKSEGFRSMLLDFSF